MNLSVTSKHRRELRKSSAKLSAPGNVTLVAHNVGGVGGMERQLAELALGLRRSGCRVTVIARTCDLPSSAGVVFHRVRGPKRPFVLAYVWFMFVGSLAVRRSRRGITQATGAVVLNNVDAIAIHYCHQVGVPTPSRPTTLFRWNVRVAGWVKRIAEQQCVRSNKSAAYICVSNGVADEMRSHYPEIAENVVTIHNGVDTLGFATGTRELDAQRLRDRLGIPDGQAVVAFVGSEWERKGLRIVLEALPLASGWNLVVAGSGDERRYQEIAESFGVGDRVHWLGVTRDVQVVYELADAFVLPSSYETFSLVTFEAAASGLPIIATPVNGVRELIQDEKNGFLIDQEPSMIAQRLSQLVNDPALRTRLGQAARRSSLEFGWDVMVAEHQKLYFQLENSSR